MKQFQISRLGIVYIGEEVLNWHTIADSWIEKCNTRWITGFKQIILDLLEWIIPQSIKFVVENCSFIFKTTKMHLALTTMNIFQMTMDDAVDTSPDDYSKFIMSWAQAAAIYSNVWGVGGLLDDKSKQEFDTFHRKVHMNTFKNAFTSF